MQVRLGLHETKVEGSDVVSSGRIWLILNVPMIALAGQIAAWYISASPLRIMHRAPLLVVRYSSTVIV